MVVKKIRSFLLSSVALAMLSHTCIAGTEYDLANDQAQAIERGKALLNDDFLNSLIANSKEHSERGQASEEYQQFQADRLKQLPQNNKTVADTHIRYAILISDSMGDEEIHNLMRDLNHRKDVSFVLRGLLPTEKTITDVGKRIHDLIRSGNYDNVPTVYLDPRPFRDVQAEYAPQILMYRGKELLLSATGLANPDYMQEQYEEGKTGDLGNFGATHKISERDIEDVIRERAAKLDKQKLIENAKNSYWDKVTFLQLPQAIETQTREFYPIITLNEDITTPDGQVVAYQGQQINSLTQMPFTLRLVIFDATDKDQMEFVKHLPDSPLQTRYITTRFDRTLKWDAIKKVENELNSPVWMLNTDIIDSFDVRKIPTIVTADNDRDVFLINEYNIYE